MDVYIFFSISTRRASPSTSSDVGLRPWYKIWRIVWESWRNPIVPTALHVERRSRQVELYERIYGVPSPGLTQ